MRRKAISNIMFYVTTVLLILTIVFCIGSTVKSESSNETQRIENRVKEQQLLTKVKQYLNENGCCNSGVTLTYVMDESGACDYTFTIHHKRINDMSEEEREAFSAELMQACNASGNYSIGNYPFKGQGAWHFSRRKCGNAESVTDRRKKKISAV